VYERKSRPKGGTRSGSRLARMSPQGIERDT